jgi:hypothetical protein
VVVLLLLLLSVCLPGAAGLLQDGRVVFMLPWLNHVIAGTTDSPCPVTDRPQATAEEVSFILAAISDFLSIKVRRRRAAPLSSTSAGHFFCCLLT